MKNFKSKNLTKNGVVPRLGTQKSSVKLQKNIKADDDSNDDDSNDDDSNDDDFNYDDSNDDDSNDDDSDDDNDSNDDDSNDDDSDDDNDSNDDDSNDDDDDDDSDYSESDDKSCDTLTTLKKEINAVIGSLSRILNKSNKKNKQTDSLLKREITGDRSTNSKYENSITDEVKNKDKKRIARKKTNKDEKYEEIINSKAFNIIFGNYEGKYDSDDDNDEKINHLLNDDHEVCNSDDEKIFMKESYANKDTEGIFENKHDAQKITKDVCKEYSILLELRNTIQEGLLLKPKSKTLQKALTECANDINKLVKKARNTNAKEYYDLLQKDDENTCEIEYFKNKLSNVEQLRITKELKEINKHMNIDKPYRLTLLQSNIPSKYKATVLHKLNVMKTMEVGGPEYYKMKNWIDTFMKIPFNIYRNLSITMADGFDACNDYMVNSKRTLDDCVYGLDDAKLQILQMVGQWITNPSAMGTSIAIHGPPGSGKCHGLNTPILMFNGTIKMVQDICIGDVVMGDDSTSRTVLSLGSGIDELFDINTNKGKYTVNSHHILCLKPDNCLSKIDISYTNEKRVYHTTHFNNKTMMFERSVFDKLCDAESYISSQRPEDDTVEISVKEYLNLPLSVSSNLYGYKVGIKFENQIELYCPYTLGLWLGTYTTQFKQTPYSFKQYFDKRVDSKDVTTYCKSIINEQYGKGLEDAIHKYGINEIKRIPLDYRINCDKTRLTILAGIIDSSGFVISNNTFIIVQNERDKLTEDIIFLSRSLDFPTVVTQHCTAFKKIFYEIVIKGNIGKIPVKCARNIIHVGMEYPFCPVKNDPYTLGVWLGDRTIGDNDLMFYHGCSKQEKYRENFYTRYNRISSKLVELISHKYIPIEYKLNDRETRLQLLSGIIDSCGYIHRSGSYRMICFDDELAKDIVLLADCLGFRNVQNVYDRNWKTDNQEMFGKYYSIDIYGLLHNIPVRTYRNKINNSRNYHNTQSNDIIVTPKGIGMYYGFELDGNNRYVLGDFSVTHNTSIVKDGISKILGREFAFVALGGAGDSSFLEGHSYTYEGSTWGKIVQIICESKCMNPVIYFDELDKISDSPRGQEIASILTHLTDTSQNNQFQDKFFSEIELDLSKCLFIFSYNDESKVNPILKDRMYRIQTKGYDSKQKMIIAKKYLLPKIREQVNFLEGEIIIPDDSLEYIINNPKFSQNEEGVRNLKRCLEIIYTKLNLFRLIKEDNTVIFGKELDLKVKFPYTVSRKCVNSLIKSTSPDNNCLLTMYV